MPSTKSAIARPSGADLRALYIDRELGCPEIGRIFERDPTTIRNWLQQAGVSLRPRGSDARQHFKAGQKLRLGIRHTPEVVEKVRAASIARGAVPHLRNGQHWLKTAAPEDNPNWKGGATPERQEFYRSNEWKSACAAVWTRANACCERCHLDWRTVDRKTTPTFHVHHIVSFAVKELRAELSNLALLCRPCHLFVHSRANTGREFLKEAEREFSMPSLFDFMEVEAEAA